MARNTPPVSGELVEVNDGTLLLVRSDGICTEVNRVSVGRLVSVTPAEQSGTGASTLVKGLASKGAKRAMTAAAFVAFGALTGDFSSVGDLFGGDPGGGI